MRIASSRYFWSIRPIRPYSVPCPCQRASPAASYPCISRSPATWPPCPRSLRLPSSQSTRRAACPGPASWGAETDRREACHAHRGRSRDGADPGSQGQAVGPVAVNWRTGGEEGQRHPTGRASAWLTHLARPWLPEPSEPRGSRQQARPNHQVVQVRSQRGLRARGRGPLCMGPTGHLTRYHTKSGPPESSSEPGTFARTTSAQVSPVDLCEGEWQCRSPEHIFPA